MDGTQSIFISRFIGENHMVVGQDSGSLVLVNLTKERDGDTLTHYLETQVDFSLISWVVTACEPGSSD